MTHADGTPAENPTIGDRIRSIIPKSMKDQAYSYLSAAIMFLMAFGVVDDQQAALWTQLGIALVTFTFTLLYATSTWTMSLYAVVGPLGAVLMAYGLISDEKWAIVTAAVGQALGITTAARTQSAPEGTSKIMSLVSKTR